MVKRASEIEPGSQWHDGRTVKAWHVLNTVGRYSFGSSYFSVTVEFTDGTQIAITVEQ